jgi:hypothetical protein
MKVKYFNSKCRGGSRDFSSGGCSPLSLVFKGGGGRAGSIIIFSSPELKAQVSYSDRQLFVVRPSVCPSVCL